MSPHSVKLSSWPIWWCWTSLNLSFFCSFALQLQRESDICIFFHIPTEFPWGANPCNPNSGSHWVQFNEFLICAYQKFIFHASGQHKALDQSLEFMSTAKSARIKNPTFGAHESDLIDKNLSRALLQTMNPRSFTRCCLTLPLQCCFQRFGTNCTTLPSYILYGPYPFICLRMPCLPGLLQLPGRAATNVTMNMARHGPTSNRPQDVCKHRPVTTSKLKRNFCNFLPYIASLQLFGWGTENFVLAPGAVEKLPGRPTSQTIHSLRHIEYFLGTSCQIRSSYHLTISHHISPRY